MQRLKWKMKFQRYLGDYFHLLLQGAGIQANDTDLKNSLALLITKTEIECRSEREVLRMIMQIVTVQSQSTLILLNQIVIASELFDHDGKKLYSNTIKGKIDQSLALCHSMGQEILSTVGAIKINQLDKLKDDFNYTP